MSLILFFITLLLFLVASISITYSWIIGSHIYIDISRSYASSSYPGDITTGDKLFYLIAFPTSLLIVLLICSYLIYLIFKNRVVFSLSKKLLLFMIPIICTVFIFVNLYFFIY